jgi:hypothetical protein
LQSRKLKRTAAIIERREVSQNVWLGQCREASAGSFSERITFDDEAASLTDLAGANTQGRDSHYDLNARTFTAARLMRAVYYEHAA